MSYDYEKIANLFICVSNGCKLLTEERKGSRIYDSFILRYVTSGSGTFVADGKSYRIKKGQSCLTFPFTSAKIYPDENGFLEYKWIEIKGSIATWFVNETKFRRDNPVLGEFPVSGIDSYFDIGEINTHSEYAVMRANGKLFILFSLYIEHFPCVECRNTDYVFKAREYIQRNYCEPECNVQSVADSVKIDRTYLYRLFKKETGMSIIAYINECRVAEAKMMLMDADVPISSVALSVGFPDQMYFSRVFKRLTGKTPSEYRKIKKKTMF